MEKFIEQIEEIHDEFDCGKISGDQAMEMIAEVLQLKSAFVEEDLLEVE